MKLSFMRLARFTRFLRAAVISVAVLPAAAGLARAETTKTYEVTGPVLEMTDSTVTVQKGKEKWQLARDKDTKVKGDLKVGSKVTIEYTMTAKAIEVKGGADKGAKADAAPKADKKAETKK
jgi:hypothetical protein